jgi:putative transposase
MMGALLRGVSTRQYEEVLPEMAATAGVSRGSVSRQAIEGSAEQLRQLRERRWDNTEILAIYIDGQRFGAHHVISGHRNTVSRKRSRVAAMWLVPGHAGPG